MSGASKENQMTINLNSKQAAEFVRNTDPAALTDSGVVVSGTEKTMALRGNGNILNLFGVFELLKKSKKKKTSSGQTSAL